MLPRLLALAFGVRVNLDFATVGNRTEPDELVVRAGSQQGLIVAYRHALYGKVAVRRYRPLYTVRQNVYQPANILTSFSITKLHSIHV